MTYKKSNRLESLFARLLFKRPPLKLRRLLPLAALWILLALSFAPQAEAQTVASIGGSTACTASGGTDVLFLIDNSSSIDADEYATYAATILTIASALRTANPATRLAVAHYAGPDSGAAFGQNIYFERDFSSAALSSPRRQFGPGGAYNTNFIMDNLAGAVLQMSYGLDADVSTASAFIVSPLTELNRDLTRPLQIVAFTDAGRDSYNNSAIIDGAGYASAVKDGSAFTIYNRLKAQGVKFSMGAFYTSAYPAGEQAAAAIASVGGSWSGAVEANAQDPEGSGIRPRRLESSSTFSMDSAKILNFVTPISQICPPPPMDYGDAPVSYGSPGHLIVSGGPRLGTNGADAESTPHHSANALGDDSNGADDEDGIVFGAAQIGQSLLVTAFAPMGSASGYLNAWIDWNRDGDFLDAGEQILLNRRDDGTLQDSVADDGQIQFLVDVPPTASAGQTFARFRLSTQAGLAPDVGVAPDGEIEDHALTIAAYAPPGGAAVGPCARPNLLANGDFSTSANWTSSHGLSLVTGEAVVGDVSFNSTLTSLPLHRANAAGVFRSSMNVSGNLASGGVSLRNETLVSVAQGRTYVFSYDFQRIANAATAPATIAWALVDPTTSAVVQVIPGGGLTLNGSTSASWTQYASTFAATAPTGTYKVAMTFTQSNVLVNAFDYRLDRVYFAPLGACDFGDAPATYGAPMHLIAGGLKLGAAAPDSEIEHQPNAAATGDDAAGFDDEDGFSAFPTLLSGATSYSIPPGNVSAAGGGTLRAWIDFDKNGVFTADEHASAIVSDGALSGPLHWTGITIGAVGGSYARLRFTSTTLTDLTATTALDERATDPAFDGEAEDYAVNFVPASLPPSAGMAVCASPGPASLSNAMAAVWTHNDPPGTLDGAIAAVGLPASELASVAPLAVGAGLTYTRPSLDFTAYYAGGADLSSAAAAYGAQDYVAYRFTTAATLGAGRYLRNVLLHRASSSYPTRFPFRTTILISTDPNFSTATVVVDAWLLSPSGVDDQALRVSDAPVLLAPSTTYYLRAILHDVTATSGSVFWDDFAVLIAGCADRSDAPASYGEADHAGDGVMRLGAARSVDDAPVASADAQGDGATDDGVFFGTAAENLSLQNRGFVQGAAQRLEFLVSGAGGRLSGWFDWNRDGRFSSPEEQAFVDVMDGGPGDLEAAAGVVAVEVTPPALMSGASFARFRWSGAAGLGPTGPAPSGEVEDYAVGLTAQDSFSFLLSPSHESVVPAGQLAIYPHRLSIGEGLGGGTLAFVASSDAGLDWRLLRDDGDGIYGAADAPWPSGGAPLAAGSYGFWLVARVPQDAAEGWRDATSLRASIVAGSFSRSAEVQDVTRAGDPEAGRLFARKLQALDGDCDGLSDAGEAGFTADQRTIAPGGCVIYRIVFENVGVGPITRVRVYDHTPNWMIYRAGSAQTQVSLTGLTPLTPVFPAANQEGEVSFPFDGALQPGQSGLVQFSLRLLGGG